ncbi:hypothetical protein PSH79_10825 [Pseudomonas sp. FP2196]|uniref:hypothetical protein n=1 Tax=Pseudomonas sp. FP2196 TaxID=2954086 RepID=UPI0027354D52|nr:hypothetical protein [Pseudomonas sp. FP2196]WLH37766.1 hypothetical protein PSH79_10825 [Pseudomonas sp. FP2196]
MSKYASQVIISFLSGKGDTTIIGGTNSIISKGTSSGLPSHAFIANTTSPQTIAQTISATMAPWRLYLRGHGSHSKQLLGPFTVDQIAHYLSQCGLSANLPDVVSVTACKLGLGAHQSTTVTNYQSSYDSFVGKLHKLLGNTYGVYTTLHGRTMNNAVIRVAGASQGRKTTRQPMGNHIHQQSFAKVTYYWDDNNNQQVTFAYGEMDIDVDDGDAMDIEWSLDMMDIG